MANLVQAFNGNLLRRVDQYKQNQWLQLPEGCEMINNHVVPRKPFMGCNVVCVMGNQFLANILAAYRVTQEEVDDAARRAWNEGAQFNTAGWQRVVDEFDGALPMAMRGLPDGTISPVGVPISSLESSPEFDFVVGYIETWYQDTSWLMTTVATRGLIARRKLQQFCIDTGTDPAWSESMWTNFGSRSAGGAETDAMVGAAHGVYFNNSDCTLANDFIQEQYNTTMVRFRNVMATEHSTMCANSDAETLNDYGAFRMTMTLLAQAVAYARVNPNALPITSAVIDTYDDERYANQFVPDAFLEIQESGGKYVLRPDTGNALTKPCQVFRWLESGLLKRGFNVMKKTSKGFDLLPDCLGILQSDGLSLDMLDNLIAEAKSQNLAAANFIYGCGAGITSDPSRNDFSFSQKAVAMFLRAVGWRDLLKKPKSDLTKESWAGRTEAYRGDDGVLFGDRVDVVDGFVRHAKEAFVDFAREGSLLCSDTFESVMERATEGLTNG